ncbi:uncharacterized protein LOC119560141 [Drosophila subpulchrella]|uniref:uncharacterized protein LOC119560141 n=1 Tax=Drosophila subpulchrella TaxID=1486046 RepID=UPI0018A198A2|nr:uncharacterized protein LOC119560141 [Drosophila subpulchrella]
MLAFGTCLFAILAIHLATAQETTTGATETTTSAAEKDAGTTALGAAESSSTNDTDTVPDYCDPSLCSAGQKHVACNDTVGLHSECSLDAEVVVINDRLEKFILRRFNELRDSVAKGGFNGLSPAARMGTLKWDQELAFLAKYNVHDCVMRHDQCRNTKTAVHAGQTVGYRGIKGKIPVLEDVLKDITSVWMRENTGTSMLDIMKYKDPHKGPPKYNFIQIVLENAEFVGCAIVQQSHNRWHQTFFTCNYGHAPVVGAKVYESGQEAGKLCKTGVNPKYVHLCSETETYEKVGPTVGNSSDAEVKTRTVRKGDFVMLSSDKIQPRDGSEAATPAPEGGAAQPAEGETTTGAPGAEGAVTPTAAAGETPAPAPGAEPPGAGVTPGSPGAPSKAGTPGPVEGILEPDPEPLDKDALEKKFERFLEMMKHAEQYHGRRKVVLITSNHEVEDYRTKETGGEGDPHLRTLEQAVYSRIRSRRLKMRSSGIMLRTMSHSAGQHRRSRSRKSSFWAPQWIGIA